MAQDPGARLSAADDERLVERCRRGDPGAWDSLVDAYAPYVHAIVVRGFGLQPEDAADVFQETFSRVHVQLGHLNRGAALRPWIGRIARNLAIDHTRASRRRAAAPLDDDQLPDPGAVPALERVEAAMDVHDALRRLAPECREVLERFYLRDESYTTIAAALGLPTGTLSARMARCLQRLRDTFIVD